MVSGRVEGRKLKWVGRVEDVGLEMWVGEIYAVSFPTFHSRY